MNMLKFKGQSSRGAIKNENGIQLVAVAHVRIQDIKNFEIKMADSWKCLEYGALMPSQYVKGV
jgi:hypothetical protein